MNLESIILSDMSQIKTNATGHHMLNLFKNIELIEIEYKSGYQGLEGEGLGRV